MGVRDTLEAARASTIDLRRIEERTEILRQNIGVQGHSYEFHAKVGILDPSRQIDALLDWQDEHEGIEGLQECIEEARTIIEGAARIIDPLAVEALLGYYVEGKSMHAVAARLLVFAPTLEEMGETDRLQVVHAALEQTVSYLEGIGYARLRALGLPH